MMKMQFFLPDKPRTPRLLPARQDGAGLIKLLRSNVDLCDGTGK